MHVMPMHVMEEQPHSLMVSLMDWLRPQNQIPPVIKYIGVIANGCCGVY